MWRNQPWLVNKTVVNSLVGDTIWASVGVFQCQSLAYIRARHSRHSCVKDIRLDVSTSVTENQIISAG